MIYVRTDMRYLRYVNLEWHDHVVNIEERRRAVYETMLGPGCQSTWRANARWRDPITVQLP